MREIKIDFDNPGFPQRLDVVENDAQSRFFKAVLYKDGKAYAAPSGATYSIMYRGFGPQNEGWYDTINDGAGKRAACSVSGNVVTCEIARQALRVPGHVSVVLCVTGSNGYMLHGWPIDCNCRNDNYTGGTSVESFFYITQVTNADWTSAIKTWEELKNIIDPTLSVEGKAADAAKVGEAINAESERAKGAEKQIKEDLNNVTGKIPTNYCYVSVNYNSLKENSGFDSYGRITSKTNTCVLSDFIPVVRSYKITWIAYCGISIAAYSGNSENDFVGFRNIGYDISSVFKDNLKYTNIKYIRLSFNKNYSADALYQAINLLIETEINDSLVSDLTASFIQEDIDSISRVMQKAFYKVKLNISDLRRGYGFDSKGNLNPQSSAAIDRYIPVYNEIKAYCPFAGMSIALYKSNTADTFTRFAFAGTKRGLQVVAINADEKYARIAFDISGVSDENFKEFVLMTAYNIIPNIDNSIRADVTISDFTREKMSHGSEMVYKDGFFYNIYIGDETHTEETPENIGTYCNLAKINICDYSDISFIGVAKVGDTFDNITIENRPPYEPNVLVVDNYIYCYFDCLQNDEITYFCRKFDTETNTFENHLIPLTIDGKTLNLTNALSSYNNYVTGNNTLTDMMLTSRMITHNGMYYAYLSGYGNYKGMLVSSQNGIDWTSISAPSTSLVSNISEAQIEVYGDNLYCLFRNTGYYILSASFDLNTLKWNNFNLIFNTVQTRPQTILVNNVLYRMCNYEKSADGLPMRSKAVLEKYDKESDKWYEVKTFILNSGFHYYSFCKVGTSLYMAYSTDKRNLNFSQVRSNIQLHRIF